MFSAPHAVLQTRNGSLKAAERYTGMLCLLLNRRAGCPCIYKASHRNDDANFDPRSDYRDALCRYINEKKVRYLLDLHQLRPSRPMDVCLGTGLGKNLLGRDDVLTAAESAFREKGFAPVTVDTPFSASGRNTVSATVARVCAVPALQIELNSRLLMEDDPGERFVAVMAALYDLCRTLSQLPSGDIRKGTKC